MPHRRPANAPGNANPPSTTTDPPPPPTPPSAPLPPTHTQQALQELDLGYTPLPRLPPALAHATSLRRLALRGCLAAPLSAHDVRGVLARLPALAELSLDAAALPPGQELDVRAELPRVRITAQ